ncbi:MAG: hypothetical protein P1U40_13065 [Coxiellaceae bacterium]|nr:hypothetical protein [Coxiellaceae bacterium]
MDDASTAIAEQEQQQKTTISHAGISFFASPNINIEQTLASLAKDSFKQWRQKLVNGDVVNLSENRPAWHTACREPKPNERVEAYLKPMQRLCQRIRQQTFNQLIITDVVNIGIGGSDLGPKLVCEAFNHLIDGPRPHFVSNLDCSQMRGLLRKLNPKHTLFVVASKSFKTLETIENLQLAKAWLKKNRIEVKKHMIAISNSTETAAKQSFAHDQVLYLPEWVGGRFSLWSTVGLTAAIALGFDRFEQLLSGAHHMDQHFLNAEANENIPLVYASQLFHLIRTERLSNVAILPYSHHLRSLTEYLQQLFMESLGKGVNSHGIPISTLTGPIVFGGAGTNCQHSYQQLMMQGNHRIMTDFILPLQQSDGDSNTQALLTANCLTQLRTLRNGALDEQQPQKSIRGQQVANLFVLEELSLKTLGSLIAMYEHAVFTLGFLLDINPFDQWGVERAKQDSHALYEKLKDQPLTLEQVKEVL